MPPTITERLRRLRALRTDPTSLLCRLHAEHERTAPIRLAGRDLLVLTHPEPAWELLTVHHGAVRKGQALRRARALLGDGLLTSEGQAHLTRRRLVQPAFSRSAMPGYTPLILRAVRERTQRWEDGAELDVAEEMGEVMLGIAGHAVLGIPDLAGSTPLRRDVVRLLSRSVGDPRFAVLPGSGAWRASRRIRRAVSRLVAGSSDASGTAVLERLHSDAGLDPDEVRDETVTLLLAGHETTALTLTWALAAVARDRDVQRALQAEVDAVLADGRGGLREPTDRDALPYVTAVLAETLRLWPPAWVIGRQAVEPFMLDGVDVRPGTTLIVSPFALHRDPRWWDEAERFRPERWLLDEGGTRQVDMRALGRPGGAFLPFGAGPRRCIGEAFAWTEARLALATIAANWRLEPHGPAPAVGRPSVTLRPSGPVRVIGFARS